jgi:biotin carboxyl carrier protein
VSEAQHERSAAERAADHAAIERLTDGLLPALVAKLGATGLGELEVREGTWRVRLRRPADAPPRGDGAGTGRSKRRDRGDGGGDRSDGRERTAGRATTLLDGTTARDDSRHVATSPAVGIYRPRTDLVAGTRVRAGDRLGAVDMLGVAQEVVAPADGLIGVSLAEAGDAVEYGQQLLVIEYAPPPSSTNGSGATG